MKRSSLMIIKKTRHVKLWLLMVIAVVFWTIGTGFYRDLSAKSEDAYEELKVFSDVIEMIEREYVDEVDTKEKLELKNFNISFDIGAGFDLYYPLFKFSPEVRYSFGVKNLLSDKVNEFSENLDQIVTHNIAFFITFEGGPNYLKRRRKNRKLTEE